LHFLIYLRYHNRDEPLEVFSWTFSQMPLASARGALKHQNTATCLWYACEAAGPFTEPAVGTPKPCWKQL